MEQRELSKMPFSRDEILALAMNLQGSFEAAQEMYLVYHSAIREIRTKFEILDDEFKIQWQRNPIEYMKARVKSPKSLLDKLARRGFEVSVSSARENLNDIAGIRVVCSFVEDIYTLAEMLIRQDDIQLIQRKDYIQNPKPNGYRSLHLVVEVPVFFSNHCEPTRVEVQIRTIAMDFWASLEHQLRYKGVDNVPPSVSRDLKECADIIAATDQKMQQIHNILNGTE